MNTIYSDKYNLNGNIEAMRKIGILRYTTNLNLRFYERQFLNNIYNRISFYGLNTMITGYDIKGINEIYNRIFPNFEFGMTNLGQFDKDTRYLFGIDMNKGF